MVQTEEKFKEVDREGTVWMKEVRQELADHQCKKVGNEYILLHKAESGRRTVGRVYKELVGKEKQREGLRPGLQEKRALQFYSVF